MDVPQHIRGQIVALSLHGNKTQREIAHLCDVGQKTVSRIMANYRSRGSTLTNRKGVCGRKRATTARDDSAMRRKSMVDPRLTSGDLQRDLQQSGVNVSSSTVRRRLLEVGRKAQKPLKKQLLTVSMKKKRLSWAKNHLAWTEDHWKKVRTICLI